MTWLSNKLGHFSERRWDPDAPHSREDLHPLLQQVQEKTTNGGAAKGLETAPVENVEKREDGIGARGKTITQCGVMGGTP
jgi:hypothetical protein